MKRYILDPKNNPVECEGWDWLEWRVKPGNIERCLVGDDTLSNGIRVCTHFVGESEYCLWETLIDNIPFAGTDPDWPETRFELWRSDTLEDAKESHKRAMEHFSS